MATPLSAARALEALRSEGLKVVQHGSWKTHNRGSRGTGWGPLNGIMIHHTVTSGVDGTVRLCYQGRSDLPGPLCHGVIDKQGTVHLVGWGRANHAGLGDDDVLRAVIREDDRLPAPNERSTDGNSRFYGFECINRGDGEDPWPEAQLDAIARVSAALCRAHGWGANSVIGHKEWTSWKVDPRGFSMDDMRHRVAARLKHDPNYEEDDMPSAKEIAEAVWETDGVVPVPADWGAPGNDTWKASSILSYIGRHVLAAERKTEAGNAAIGELAKTLAARDTAVDVDDLVARIEAAIERVTVRLDVQQGGEG